MRDRHHVHVQHLHCSIVQHHQLTMAVWSDPAAVAHIHDCHEEVLQIAFAQCEWELTVQFEMSTHTHDPAL